MPYAIATPHSIKRQRIEDQGFMGIVKISGESAQEWRIEPAFGFHARNVDAKRAFLVQTKELTGDVYTDEFIVRYFKYILNLGIAKVVKVAAAEQRLAPDPASCVNQA